MKILGIETSCDETAAAVVKNGTITLSNTVVSSLNEHKQYGGIIPEIASRKQIECINVVVRKSLVDAHTRLNDIDAIAVTQSPGLIGSLLVGISFARALSYILNKPLIEIDHVQAHLHANFLVKVNNKKSLPENIPSLELPAIGLVVSGGHTNLYLMKDFHKYQLLGHTLDDAAGEAFDKVAHLLGLGYPGGPAIDRLTKEVKKTNIQFTCAPLPGTFNFSFSGIKTAVLYHLRKHKKDKNFSVRDVAFAFQQSVVSTLADKCFAACRKYRIKTLLIGGGVAANSALRTLLKRKGQLEGVQISAPPVAYCLDNAAMIAGFGFHCLKKGGRHVQSC